MPNAQQPLSPHSAVLVPEHVVVRSFPGETIMLNLQTGVYHGLNPTAGRMLETLERHAVIGDAAAVVAEQYGREEPSVLADLLTLCSALLERRSLQSVVVVAVRSEPDFAAHAWVEHDGLAVLPPGSSSFQRLIEL